MAYEANEYHGGGTVYLDALEHLRKSRRRRPRGRGPSRVEIRGYGWAVHLARALHERLGWPSSPPPTPARGSHQRTHDGMISTSRDTHDQALHHPAGRHHVAGPSTGRTVSSAPREGTLLADVLRLRVKADPAERGGCRRTKDPARQTDYFHEPSGLTVTVRHDMPPLWNVSVHSYVPEPSVWTVFGSQLTSVNGLLVFCLWLASSTFCANLFGVMGPLVLDPS